MFLTTFECGFIDQVAKCLGLLPPFMIESPQKGSQSNLNRV